MKTNVFINIQGSGGEEAFCVGLAQGRNGYYSPYDEKFFKINGNKKAALHTAREYARALADEHGLEIYDPF